ncbi:hypothetical protein CspHIS471_0703950 [Cutaneotrichosporon sp. HIS471]|nr:hypothetical protein CspHIS471_0703950 [Cutaneotrichosporon sp. HIS471]
MLLKRLAPSLPPEAASLVPLLEPQVRTTESAILTPRPMLHALVVAALPEEGTGPFASARRDAAVDASLDLLLQRCLDRVSVYSGDISPLKPWHGFGVLADVMPSQGGVIEIAGGKGVGKSLLALHAALGTLIAEPDATAHWVDTEGAFNAARARAVVNALGADESVLDRLTVARVFKLEPDLLDELARARDDPATRVIIIDNVASLFRDALMGTTAQGHAAMVVTMEEIAELTYFAGLTTLVINSVASSIPSNPLSVFSTTTVKPSLGVTLTFTVDVELLLQDTGRVFGLADEGERERVGSAPGLRLLVEVLKSRTSDGISLHTVIHITMTRLPTVQVDEPPSPALSAAPAEEEDHDDDLSINSSDLDDEGWLNVDNTDAASAATSTASVLGSSVISDLANSTREPSEASDSEVEVEDDATLELNPKIEPSLNESMYADTETPATSNMHEFKNSWIFPDPTSSNASLATTGTVTDNTPTHSLPNIRAVPHRSVECFIEEDDSEGPAPVTNAPVALTMPAPDSKKKTAPGNPFLAYSPGAEGNRWAVLPILIGLLLILVQLGPSPLELAPIMSHKWGSNSGPATSPGPPPAQSNWALGTADLQVVKDTLAALTTSNEVVPKDVPTEAPTAPSEYLYVWNKLRKGGKTSTDLIETTTTNSLVAVPQIRRRACQCPPKQCKCPPAASILDHLLDGIVALDTYARWMSDIVAGLVYHAGQWVRNEVELELNYQGQLLDAFVKSPAVRVIVESAMDSPKTVVRLYQNARDRVCANGRCERATEAAHQAQGRGWRSILQARRGLDVALTHGQRAVDTAMAASNELLNGAVAGARTAGERYAEKKAKKKP